MAAAEQDVRERTRRTLREAEERARQAQAAAVEVHNPVLVWTANTGVESNVHVAGTQT